MVIFLSAIRRGSNLVEEGDSHTSLHVSCPIQRKAGLDSPQQLALELGVTHDS